MGSLPGQVQFRAHLLTRVQERQAGPIIAPVHSQSGPPGSRTNPPIGLHRRDGHMAGGGARARGAALGDRPWQSPTIHPTAVLVSHRSRLRDRTTTLQEEHGLWLTVFQSLVTLCPSQSSTRQWREGGCWCSTCFASTGYPGTMYQVGAAVHLLGMEDPCGPRGEGKSLIRSPMARRRE